MLRFRTLLFKALYWLAVLVISLALLVLLVLFFESRDSSDLEDSNNSGTSSPVAARVLQHEHRGSDAVSRVRPSSTPA
jgi:hypothetical protein